jgi:GNAT superfamily N-acetyltransferase
LLGFASYSPSRDSDADPGRVGEISAIYLLPSAWDKGIGRQLMDATLACLATAGFTQVTLWVLDSNVRARRFYEAGGWSADGGQKLDESRGFPHNASSLSKIILVVRAQPGSSCACLAAYCLSG